MSDFWLPRWLLNRTVAHSKVEKAVRWLMPVARFIDRWLWPRLTFFTRGASIYVIAVVCVVIALGMPAMEVVPFSATGAGIAFLALGLSLITNDGLLALVAFAVLASAFGFVIYKLV